MLVYRSSFDRPANRCMAEPTGVADSEVRVDVFIECLPRIDVIDLFRQAASGQMQLHVLLHHEKAQAAICRSARLGVSHHKACGTCGNYKVACHRQRKATARQRAMHAGNHRHAQALQAQHTGVEGIDGFFNKARQIVTVCMHGRHIATRAKRAPLHEAQPRGPGHCG